MTRSFLHELMAGFLAFLATASLATASDWPQILGPHRNGIYDGNDLAENWPKEGPAQLWKKNVGSGFAGPAAAAGKLILFHRVGDTEVIDCMAAADGKAVWHFEYPTHYVDSFGFDPGPRAVPTIADGMVYTLGAEGAVHCVDFANGKELWNVSTKRTFSAPKGFFGMACSPLVEGDAVILNIGGPGGAGTIALDKSTGKLLWKATDDAASYSSPIGATLGTKRRALVFSRSGLFALDPSTGKQSFEFPWRPSIEASVSAAIPIVSDNLVFISASYDTGAALLRVKDGAVEKVWTGDDSISSHYSTCVLRDGFLYGIHGRHDYGNTELRCIELTTGKVHWSQPNLSAANVLLAGNRLLVLTENGELIRAAASPDKYSEISRAQILGKNVRAYPALADGLFFARNKDTLVCTDLRKR